MATTRTPRRPAKATAAGKTPRPHGGGAPASDNGSIGALVAELADRLRQSHDLPDPPFVVVNRIAPTRSIYVTVIWDKWKNLAIAQRDQIIADATAAAYPNDHAVVRLPLGLTPGEALAQGYLPYQIIPLVRPTDGVSAAAVRQAMNSAGGVRMQVGDELQLRFATRGQASEAYRRLVEQINKPIWAMSEETSASDFAD